MVLGIKEFGRLPRFKKAYRRLDGQRKAAVEVALDELKSDGKLSTGRNLEKVRSSKNTWAIRVSKGIRMTFKVANGTCILRNVGEHDKILDNA